jgi:hypothetical protein
MTIGYAPLDPVDRPTPYVPVQTNHMQKNFMDTTECNYLVMFFVIGVLGLAVKDMIAK